MFYMLRVLRKVEFMELEFCIDLSLCLYISSLSLLYDSNFFFNSKFKFSSLYTVFVDYSNLALYFYVFSF